MDILMILYAALIPVVPLMGYEYFKKRGQRGKKYLCAFLFFVQLVISGSAVYMRYFA